MMSIAATIQADQEPRRFRELRELLAPETLGPETNGPTFYVNEYEIDLAYGGSEEGGWHYPHGRFIQCHGNAGTEPEARELREKMEPQVAQANSARPSLSSVRSRGRLELRIEEHPGADFPQQRPFYE